MHHQLVLTYLLIFELPVFASPTSIKLFTSLIDSELFTSSTDIELFTSPTGIGLVASSTAAGIELFASSIGISNNNTMSPRLITVNELSYSLSKSVSAYAIDSRSATSATTVPQDIPVPKTCSRDLLATAGKCCNYTYHEYHLDYCDGTGYQY